MPDLLRKHNIGRGMKILGIASLFGISFVLGAQNRQQSPAETPAPQAVTPQPAAAATPAPQTATPQPVAAANPAPRAQAKPKMPVLPGRICLIIADIGTADTVSRTEDFLARIKLFNTNDLPQPAANTQQPAAVRQEIIYRYHDEVQRYSDREREVSERNRRMENILTELRNSIVVYRRELLFGKNYLQSYMQPYADFIQVIDLSEATMSAVEKAVGGNDRQDIASICCFLTVLMQDIQEEANTVQVADIAVRRTNYTQKAVATVRDAGGRVILSCHVTARSTFRQTSGTVNAGHNPASDLMENALRQIAEKTAAHFLCKLNFKCTGPADDDDFDPESAVFRVDGKEFENGSAVLCGEHIFTVRMNGYQPVVRKILLKKGAGSRTVVLKFKRKASNPPGVSGR